jgi:Protein of unknown function (DUF1579)
MKRTALALGAFLFFAAACNNTADPKADGGEKKTEPKKEEATKEATPPPMDEAAAMKAWNDFKTPGEMHKWIASTDGIWTADVTQMVDPAASPTKSTATIINKTVLGGLYQTGSFKGTMFGQPFEGISTLGYDNAKKVFVNTWIDNMGSGFVYMTGQYDAATKTLNLKGKQTDPMTGMDSDIREVIVFIDANNQKMEMFGAGMDGKETKFMEMVSTRKK